MDRSPAKQDKGKSKVPSSYFDDNNEEIDFNLPKFKRLSVGSVNAALDKTWAGFSEPLPTTEEEEGETAAEEPAAKPYIPKRPHRPVDDIQAPSFLPPSLWGPDALKPISKPKKKPAKLQYEHARRARNEKNIYTHGGTDDLAEFLRANGPPSRLPSPPALPPPPPPPPPAAAAAPSAAPKRKKSAHESLRSMFWGSKPQDIPPVPRLDAGDVEAKAKLPEKGGKEMAAAEASSSSSKSALSRLTPWRKKPAASVEMPIPDAREVDEPYLVGNSVLVDKISPNGKKYTAIEGWCPSLKPGEKLTPTRKFVRRSSIRSPETPKRSETSGVSKAGPSKGSPLPRRHRRHRASIGPPPSMLLPPLPPPDYPPPPPPIQTSRSPCMESIHRNLTEAKDAYEQRAKAPRSSTQAEGGESSMTGSTSQTPGYTRGLRPPTPRPSPISEWPQQNLGRVRSFQSQHSQAFQAQLRTRESIEELKTKVAAVSRSPAPKSNTLVVTGALSPINLPPPSPIADYFEQTPSPRNPLHSNVHPLVRENWSSPSPSPLILSSGQNEAASSSTRASSPWSRRTSSMRSEPASSTSRRPRGSRIPRLAKSSSKRQRECSPGPNAVRSKRHGASGHQASSSSTNLPKRPLLPGRHPNPNADRFRFPEIPSTIHEVNEPLSEEDNGCRQRLMSLLQPGAPQQDPFVTNPLGILPNPGLPSLGQGSPSSVYSDRPRDDDISALSLTEEGGRAEAPSTPEKAPSQADVADGGDDELEALMGSTPLTPEEQGSSPGSLIPKALRLSAMSACTAPQTPRGDALYMDPVRGSMTSPDNPFIGGARRLSQAPRSELEARVRSLERTNALYEMALGSMVRVTRRQATLERRGAAPAEASCDDDDAQDGEGEGEDGGVERWQ